jgi:hypothetical protein
MTKRHLTAAVFVVALISVWLGHNHLREAAAYVRELEQFRTRELRNWVATQRASARALDRAVAEALVADPQRATTALKAASEQAWSAREALWRSPPLDTARSQLDRWGYQHFYAAMGEYLDYLTARGCELPLGAIDLQNLNLIRTYADVFYAGFDELLQCIQYEQQSPEGTVYVHYYTWKQIVEDAQVISVLERLGQELNSLPAVGSSDTEFQAYQDASRAAIAGSLGLANSDEPVLGQQEILERAEAFLAALVAALTGPPAPPDVSDRRGALLTLSGGGSGSGIDDYRQFTVSDSPTGWDCDITVTAIGGHIMRVELRSRQPAPLPLPALLMTAEALLREWSEFEGVTLTEIERRESDQSAYLAYAVTVDGIAYVDELVTLGVAVDNRGPT